MDIGSMVSNPSANAGDVRDMGSVPWSGRYPGEGNGNPLQYSCLENPMDGGAWRATVHGFAQSCTQLSAEHKHKPHSGMKPSFTAAFNDMM